MSIPNLFKVPGWNLPSDIKIEKDPKKSNSNEVVNKAESVKVEAKPITATNKREIEETVDQSTTNTNKKKKKNKNKNKKNKNADEGENNLVNISFTEQIEEQNSAKLNENSEEGKEKKLVTKEKNKKNKQLLKQMLKSKKEEDSVNQEEDSEEEAEAQQDSSAKDQSNTKNLTPLQQKMQKQLAGAKFRQLNELLYTIPSADAYSQFQSNPQLFDDYHAGFSSQTEGWPLNPNDVFINFLKSQKSDRTLFVADMGCGEAKIAENLQTYKHIKINSFDLVKGNKFITPCDIRNVPLKNKTCDFVIFSLSLMGVNYFEFLKEAKRLLRQNGELKIAEVKSRFENLEKFIEFMKLYFGFELVNMDESNKMFVLMDFKINPKLKTNPKLTPPKLKPCIYKRR